MSLLTDIADAVTDLLNGEEFDAEFTAVRLWDPDFNLRELADLRVTVIPGHQLVDRVARGRNEHTCPINIGVQQRVEVDADAETELPNLSTDQIDGLHGLLEQIVNFLLCRPLASPAAMCTKAEYVGIAPSHLEQLHVVTDVAVLTYESQERV